MAERGRLFHGKKFLWDGNEYDDEEAARKASETYASDGFDVEVWVDDGRRLVYTRREVKESAIEQN